MFKALAFASSSHDLEVIGGLLARGLAVVLLVAVCLYLARIRTITGRDPGAAGMGLVVATIALVSPLTWQHHLVVLMLPLAIALRAWLEDPDGRRLMTGFLLPYMLVGLIDPRLSAWREVTAGWAKGARDIAWSVLPLAATAGIAWTAILAWKSVREPRG